MAYPPLDQGEGIHLPLPPPWSGGGKPRYTIIMVKIHNLHKFLGVRKELRQNQTPTEEKLWWYLKDKKLGEKFRRQHSVEAYILDFYCKKKKLIIEIDGGIHKTKANQEHDAIRDEFFTSLGYKTLRFSNDDVEKNINEVLGKIKSCL